MLLLLVRAQDQFDGFGRDGFEPGLKGGCAVARRSRQRDLVAQADNLDKGAKPSETMAFPSDKRKGTCDTSTCFAANWTQLSIGP